VSHQWQRRADESDQAWMAFIAYRDQGVGNRSLPRLTVEMERPKSYTRQLEKWSSEHQWQVRVAAWDQHIQDMVDEQDKAQVADMLRRHRTLAKLLWNKSIDYLQNVDLTGLPPSKAVETMKTLIQVERLAYGEPTENMVVGMRDHRSIDEMSDEELLEIVARGKAERGEGARSNGENTE
jgi:hypothetical protein